MISVRLYQILLPDKFDSNFVTGFEDSSRKEPVSKLTDSLTGSCMLFSNLFTLVSSSFQGLKNCSLRELLKRGQQSLDP